MAATIKDVADRAGVGIGTVSRVLNDDKAVKPRTRERVLAAVSELQYAPNRMASRLRKNETRNIALLVPVINHPFFAKFAYYVEDEADKFGYSVILVSSQQNVRKEADIIQRIRRREVDGAVFVTHYEHDPSELEGCCIASIDRSFGDSIPYVTSDNYAATVGAVEYLLNNGCKKVGFVGSRPIVKSEVMDRERAYLDVMAKHGLHVRSMNEDILHGEENSVVSEFLNKYPDIDGIFASGCSMAQALYDEAIARGLKIPENLQIVSYDGDFAKWGGSSVFTSVEQPIEAMAREVVRLLIDKIRGKETAPRTELKTNFIIGKTTK